MDESRDETPELVAVYDQCRDQGLTIVGVNLQEPHGNVREFAEDFGIRFPVVIDRKGEVANKWRLGGPLQGIPTSYFPDETGVVPEFFYGSHDRERLERAPGNDPAPGGRVSRDSSQGAHSIKRASESKSRASGASGGSTLD